MSIGDQHDQDDDGGDDDDQDDEDDDGGDEEYGVEENISLPVIFHIYT